jgi:hypothetical protein
MGIRAAAKMRSVRARSVVRLLTAIALHHAAEPRRALSVLNEIEGPARAGHVDGDFLLPSIIAWTALIAAVSGDHERADAHLAESDAPSGSDASASEVEPAAAHSDSPPTVIIDELVTPPLRIASALRALDRLDLERAGAEFDALSAYPEMRTLWVYLPFIARISAVLSVEAESGLLFVNDDAERFRDAGVLSEAEKDLIALGRSTVFIALGQLRWAEIERERLSPSCDARIVLDVRSKLVAGRNDEAISCADTWFYHHSLSPRSRAELAAIRAAAKLRSGGRGRGAAATSSTAVSLSTWVSSLLPLALLPLFDRSRLVDLTARTRTRMGGSCKPSSPRPSASPTQLSGPGCARIGPVSVDVATKRRSSARARPSSSTCWARGLSVAEIAE